MKSFEANDPVSSEQEALGRPMVALAYAIPVLTLMLLRATLPANICDDAFISFRTACHLYDGNGMVFNAGERVYAVTTPLWVGLLALAKALTSDVVVAARGLGVMFEVLALTTLVALARRLTGSYAAGMLAAILLCTNPVYLLTSFSGMELSLSLWLVLLAFYLLAGGGRFALLVAAIAVWARVDNLVVFCVVLLFVLYRERQSIRDRWRNLWRLLYPSIAVLTGYALFGLAYFGTILPASVRSKARGNVTLFSDAWWAGIDRVGPEFLRVFSGMSAYWYIQPMFFKLHFARSPHWYQQPTFYWIFALPLLVGAVILILRRGKGWGGLLAWTALYAASFLGTGNAYAYHHPWYFVPVLPALYALAAWGCMVLLRQIRRIPRIGHRLKPELIAVAIAVLWAGAQTGPLIENGEWLSTSGVGSAERERVYAAGGAWLGKHLPESASIAAVEIGAIGFYTRSDITILDMVGLARPAEDWLLDWSQLVHKHLPAAILVRNHFRHREVLERQLPERYVWSEFRTLDVGIRADLANALVQNLTELPEIYATIDMARELRR